MITPLHPPVKCRACHLVADAEIGLCALHATMNPVRARTIAEAHRTLHANTDARRRYHAREAKAWEDIAARLEKK